jgi:hypothetical protein
MARCLLASLSCSLYLTAWDTKKYFPGTLRSKVSPTFVYIVEELIKYDAKLEGVHEG